MIVFSTPLVCVCVCSKKERATLNKFAEGFPAEQTALQVGIRVSLRITLLTNKNTPVETVSQCHWSRNKRGHNYTCPSGHPNGERGWLIITQTFDLICYLRKWRARKA